VTGFDSNGRGTVQDFAGGVGLEELELYGFYAFQPIPIQHRFTLVRAGRVDHELTVIERNRRRAKALNAPTASVNGAVHRSTHLSDSGLERRSRSAKAPLARLSRADAVVRPIVAGRIAAES
jgi:hypothetical protein